VNELNVFGKGVRFIFWKPHDLVFGRGPASNGTQCIAEKSDRKEMRSSLILKLRSSISGLPTSTVIVLLTV
jgi:hypothetical protein